MLEGVDRFDVLAGNWLYAHDYGDYTRMVRLNSLGYSHSPMQQKFHLLTDGAQEVYTRLEVRYNRADLLAKGDLWECPACGHVGAYCYLYDDEVTGLDEGIKVIQHHSGMGEVECPHCERHLVEKDSPLLAECYTHVPPESWDSEE